MKITRRTFLKFLAGGAAGLFLTPLPWKGLEKISALTQAGPKPLPKGKQEFKHTLSSLCPAKTPLKIRLINGQPVQALPWPNHPLGGRGLSALAAAEVQNLFRPSRLKQPLARNSSGLLSPVSWEEAFNLLASKLANASATHNSMPGFKPSTIANGQGASFSNEAVVCVAGDEGSVGALALRQFLVAQGSAEFYSMPGHKSSLSAAWQLMGGTGQPGYDIENSDYVLSVGADLLESWGPVLRNRKVFSNTAFNDNHFETKFEDENKYSKSKYVYCGPVQNATALACQQWLPVKPGMEAYFLISLAGVILQQMPHAAKASLSKYSDLSTFEELAKRFPAQELCPYLGISEEQLQKLGRELLLAKRPVVITASSLGPDAPLQLNLLGLALNLLLGNLQQPGGLSVLPDLNKLLDANYSPALDFSSYLHKLEAGEKEQPKVLIISDCNPLYALPAYISKPDKQKPCSQNTPENIAEREEFAKIEQRLQYTEWKTLFRKIPFKVAFSSFMHDTAAECDLVLPVPAGLERWDHVYSPFGCGQLVYSICPPVFNPPKEMKSISSILEELNIRASGLLVANPLPSEKEYFEQVCRKLGTSCHEVEGKGYFCTDLQEGPLMLSLRADLLIELLCDKKNVFEAKTKLTNLVLLPLLRLDLSNANLGLSAYQGFSSGPAPFNRVKQNEATALINPGTAANMGLSEGQSIRIFRENMPKTGFSAQVCLSNRIPEGGLGLFAGCGHSLTDDFSAGKGQNIMALFSLGRQLPEATGLFQAFQVTVVCE